MFFANLVVVDIYRAYFLGLTPGHDHAPQTGEIPALFTVARQRVEPGQLISLELGTKDNSTFKGFMIQARNAELKDQQVLAPLCLTSHPLSNG